ncbi:MAG: rRNA pseudouridine synthase [Candidatus Riflebacteria bacterium]|nr:rRNA pseudouridine synthase [Candidatus Riflebacteria bacterium]
MTESVTQPIRIQKLLSDWGVASRRTVEALIDERRIKVNGETVTQQGLKVCPDTVKIEIDGHEVKDNCSGMKIFAFNKPANVLSSLKDDFERKTIKDFLKDLPRVFPVGRLDYDTTGLLLLTNDGELANRLLHPRFKVEKEYLAVIAGGDLSKEQLDMFSAGVPLEDGLTSPCQITPLGDSTYSVILREGRKRQVKRMFQYFERRVTSLKRSRFGSILLGDLPEGSMRTLSQDEISSLRKVFEL